jgi:hypothetical protein
MIKMTERLAYHPDVDVYFQANAWADTDVSLKWIERTLSPAIEDVKRFALYLNNLTAQQNDAFKEAISKMKGVCWYGLANATDLWQPVDSGIAQHLKVLTRMEQEK